MKRGVGNPMAPASCALQRDVLAHQLKQRLDGIESILRAILPGSFREKLVLNRYTYCQN